MFRNRDLIVGVAAALGVGGCQLHVYHSGCERMGAGSCRRLVFHSASQINCVVLGDVETLRGNFIRHVTELLFAFALSYGAAGGSDAPQR